MQSVFGELRRRNVLRAGALYVAAVWALAQGIAQLGPAFGMPEWGTRWFVVAAIIGFPFWLAFAWFYEFTPEGLKRESEIDPSESITAHTGKKLDRWIIGILALAVVLLLTNTFVWHKGAGLREAESAPILEHSIAVLPFVDMSSGKDQEYFSDGISEELLNLLAKIPQLQVTARTSSFSFKGKEVAIPEIARTLHVANVLEGSVRKAGNSVRITAQLIKAETDAHVWSQTYERKLDDIFAIQDEIAADVVKQLQVTLLGAAPKVPTTDPESYALYLQGVQIARQGGAEAYKQAEALDRRVLATDPNYAPAWVALAVNVSRQAELGLLPIEEGYAESRKAAEKALAIDSNYAPAHAQLGYVATGENDLAGAAQHLRRALALDPTDVDVLRLSAVLLRFLGRADDALMLIESVVRRDPVNPRALFSLSQIQISAGQLDAAIASFRTTLSLARSRDGAHAELGFALVKKGNAVAALAEIEAESADVWKMIGLPIAYHALGRKADSEVALAALIAKYDKDAAYNIATVYAFRGEADLAFTWLDKANEYGDPGLSEIATEHFFDNIRADSRWLPFLRKIGYAPEQLAKIEFKVTLPHDAASQSAEAQAAH
jgi:TolB-like protein/Tfp pilus assembly protein PilF